MKAILVLENGSVYEGTACGAAGERVGDVIINTAVVGYQEMVTDAANAGKIINQRVAPNVNHVIGIVGDIYSPRQRSFGTGKANILQAGLNYI